MTVWRSSSGALLERSVVRPLTAGDNASTRWLPGVRSSSHGCSPDWSTSGAKRNRKTHLGSVVGIGTRRAGQRVRGGARWFVVGCRRRRAPDEPLGYRRWSSDCLSLPGAARRHSDRLARLAGVELRFGGRIQSRSTQCALRVSPQLRHLSWPRWVGNESRPDIAGPRGRRGRLHADDRTDADRNAADSNASQPPRRIRRM